MASWQVFLLCDFFHKKLIIFDAHKHHTMKANKILIFGLPITLFNLMGGQAFAGTGGANDGQVMLLVILAVLSVILGMLYFFPFLVHRIRDLWNKYHHC